MEQTRYTPARLGGYLHFQVSRPSLIKAVSLLIGVGIPMIVAFPVAYSHQASPNSQIQRHLQRAAAYLKSKDLPSAVKEYDAVIRLNPGNADALTNRGAIRFLQGDCPAASEDLRAALASDPSLARPKAMLGICEKRLAKPDAASLLEASFRELRNSSMRVRVGTELASLYYQHGDLEHASAVAQQLVALDPDNVDILYFAQLVYRELAEDTLNKLALLAPDSARMQQVMAERLVNDGNLTAAIEHYKKALVLQPDLPGVHFELGEAMLNSNASDPATQSDAITQFQQAIRLEGDTAELEGELGHIAQLRGDTQTAFARYTRAVTLNENSASAQLGLGSILMDMKKPAEAARHLQLAVRLDPLNSDAHYRLALAERDLDETTDAAKEMKLFQDIRKREDTVKQIYNEMNRRPSATQ